MKLYLILTQACHAIFSFSPSRYEGADSFNIHSNSSPKNSGTFHGCLISDVSGKQKCQYTTQFNLQEWQLFSSLFHDSRFIPFATVSLAKWPCWPHMDISQYQPSVHTHGNPQGPTGADTRQKVIQQISRLCPGDQRSVTSLARNALLISKSEQRNMGPVSHVPRSQRGWWPA